MIPELFVPWPTATAVPSLRAVTPLRSATPLGVLTRRQLPPFQCSVNGPLCASPTANMSLAETAAIPVSLLRLPLGSGFGLGTKLQLVPSQCSITAAMSPGGGPGLAPTDQTLVGESAVTAARLTTLVEEKSKRLQVWPSQ